MDVGLRLQPRGLRLLPGPQRDRESRLQPRRIPPGQPLSRSAALPPGLEGYPQAPDAVVVAPGLRTAHPYRTFVCEVVDVIVRREQGGDAARGGENMDIAGWLRGLGLEQYEPAFRENDIDGDVLRRLTAEDVRDIGIASVGHRRRLLDAIKALPADTTATLAARNIPTGPE